MIPAAVAVVEALAVLEEATRAAAALPATGKHGTEAPGFSRSSSQGPARPAGVRHSVRFGGHRQSSRPVLRSERPVRVDSGNAGGAGRRGADLQVVALFWKSFAAAFERRRGSRRHGLLSHRVS